MMSYIRRDLEDEILALSKEFACLLITGPRQAGKTTLLRHLSASDRTYVTMDDLEERSLAKNDPALFLELHKAPLLIDEVQYAPELFSCLKIAIDSGAAPGSFWMTSSQDFRLMDLAGESLAGRMAVLHHYELSQHEIYDCGENTPFVMDPAVLQERKYTGTYAGREAIYERIWKGSLPGLIGENIADRDAFYSRYLQTLIDRDVSDICVPADKLLFYNFLRAAASRTGQMLNIHSIACEIGVSDDTARRWLQILEKCGIIFFLRPYLNSLLKRSVRIPKLYFFDTGLVAYLTRYTSPEILQFGALGGAILETYVVSEIMKTYQNAAQDCLLWYYRDKNSREIDLVMENEGKLHPLQIRRSLNPGTELIRSFSLLDQSSVPRGTGGVICLEPELSAIDAENFIVPVWMI